MAACMQLMIKPDHARRGIQELPQPWNDAIVQNFHTLANATWTNSTDHLIRSAQAPRAMVLRQPSGALAVCIREGHMQWDVCE